MKLRDFKTVAARRSYIEKETGIRLNAVGSAGLDDSVASSKNCENMIGATHVPLGIAGPLGVQIQHIKSRPGANRHFIPLATTEGALVASVSRGCKALTQSGGALVYAYRAGATRAPVFYAPSFSSRERFYTWLLSNKKRIKKAAEATSNHLKLMDIERIYASPYVYLRMRFDTSDAMGMNMVTIAAARAAALIEKETGARCISLSGNVDVDKKPSWRNSISGRGWHAGAEIVLPHHALSTIVKTSSSALYEVWVSKCMVGSAISGSIGSNAHMANVLAAIFIATGQDVAHIAECSSGTTICERRGKNLYMSVQLPDLMVGTVGGGTGLSTQKEALSLMKIDKKEPARTFASLVAGAVLAGELSLLASLSEGSLARAHKQLARGGA